MFNLNTGYHFWINIILFVATDSYFRWPEVYFTRSATSELTTTKVCKIFGPNGPSSRPVLDNRSHFTAQRTNLLFNSSSCYYDLTLNDAVNLTT